jgi:hypothetical protein
MICCDVSQKKFQPIEHVENVLNVLSGLLLNAQAS